MQNKSDILRHFGQRVRQLRLDMAISQEELAARCQLDRTYISGVERGQRNISLKNIAALAAALNISLSTLFEGVSTDDLTE